MDTPSFYCTKTDSFLSKSPDVVLIFATFKFGFFFNRGESESDADGFIPSQILHYINTTFSVYCGRMLWQNFGHMNSKPVDSIIDFFFLLNKHFKFPIIPLGLLRISFCHSQDKNHNMEHKKYVESLFNECSVK